ncbi:MAG: hypothetical protein R6V85_04555 [Polyangia bacterium]
MRNFVFVLASTLAVAVLCGGCDLFGGDDQSAQQLMQQAQQQAQQAQQQAQQTQQQAQQQALQQAQQGLQRAQQGMQQPAQQARQPAQQARPEKPSPTGDELTDRLGMAAYEKATGWKPTSAMMRVELKKGEEQGYDVNLPGPPFCHTIAAVAEDDVEEFGIQLEDPSENKVASGVYELDEDEDDSVEQKQHAALIQNYCPTVAGGYKVFLEPDKGAGELAIRVFSKAGQ